MAEKVERLTEQEQKEWVRGYPYSMAFTQGVVHRLSLAAARVVDLEAANGTMQDERDEARLQRNILGGIKAVSQRWLVRGRHLLTYQQKQTRVAVRQAAKFQSEAEALKAANTIKRDTLRLAWHKIEQTLAGQYPEGQALKAAQFTIRAALSDAGEGQGVDLDKHTAWDLEGIPHTKGTDYDSPGEGLEVREQIRTALSMVLRCEKRCPKCKPYVEAALDVKP